MRVAYLMSANMCADNPDRRDDGYEHDIQFDALKAEGAAHNIVFEETVWDKPDTDWQHFDAVIVGTTWDYQINPEKFFETLEHIDRHTALFNPLCLMRWNADKIYLRELATKGVPSIPTIWAEAATTEVIANAFNVLGVHDIVIKPRIGASAWRQARLKRGEALPPPGDLPPGACLIQPFLPTVTKYGEVTLLCYDGVFSHAARKIPGKGDYRVQSIYGGREVEHKTSEQERHVAKMAIAALPTMPLYARIDLVRGAQDQPVIIEVELIEPYHYPDQGPDFARPFVAALLKRLQ